jgi:hypothetical protein
MKQEVFLKVDKNAIKSVSRKGANQSYTYAFVQQSKKNDQYMTKRKNISATEYVEMEQGKDQTRDTIVS